MSDSYRVTVQIDRVTDEPAVKNRYGDVETPARRDTAELVAGTFTTTDESKIRDRVSSMLDAAGIAPPKDAGE